MEQRIEQHPRQRATPTQRKQTAMQARQLDKIVEQQQQTALILERVAGRIDALERWQEQEERAKERQSERRDDRDDKKPDLQRADLALLVSGATALATLLTFVAQHWH